MGRQVGENQTCVVYGGRWQSLPRVTGKVGVEEKGTMEVLMLETTKMIKMTMIVIIELIISMLAMPVPPPVYSDEINM